MKRALLPVLVLMLAGAVVLSFQKMYTVPEPLSDKQAEAAIVLGRANKLKGIVYGCVAGATSKAGAFAAFGVVGLAVAAAKENKSAVYDIRTMAAAGRVATAAWSSAQANQPFTLANIEADWRQPILHVVVSPVLPAKDKASTPIFPLPVKAISIKSQSSPGKTEVSSPTSPMVSVPRTWRNVSGATVEYTDTLAAFNLHLLEHLSGDSVEFVVATAEAGDRACTVSKSAVIELIRLK